MKQELAEDEEWVLDENGNYVYEEESNYRLYDEKYIEYFCQHPEQGKTEALRKAGFKGKYISQRATQIHKRLLDRIEERLDNLILEGAHVGHSVLRHLATNAESEAVKAKVAKDLIDFAGRKAIDRVNISKELSEDEREAEIQRLQEEIAEQEGRVH